MKDDPTLTSAVANKASTLTHVVALPYPGRGHVNPMLNLCRLLASRGALVTVVVTEEWLQLLGSDASSPSISFRTIPNVIPSERNRGSDLIGFLRAVFTFMEEPFEKVLDSIEPPASIVVTDMYIGWPAEVAARRGLAVAGLWTQSVAGLLATLHVAGRLAATGEMEPVALEDDNGCLKYMSRYDITQSLESEINTIGIIREVIKNSNWILNPSHKLLLTSFHELEPHAINTLHKTLPCRVHPVGPLIPYMGSTTHPTEHHLSWLDSQPESSVLYVSLGSFISVPVAQMDELAIALRNAGHRFFWVARAEAPRLRELSGGMGVVVPWCDQLGVLRHPSVGGFLTHCGWNSIQEAVFAGVPMMGFPLLWDQSPNCDLVVERWWVGVRLRGDVGKGVVVGREAIEEGVRRFMGLDGVEVRSRAEELGVLCRKAVEKGGTSYESLSEFLRSV